LQATQAYGGISFAGSVAIAAGQQELS